MSDSTRRFLEAVLVIAYVVLLVAYADARPKAEAHDSLCFDIAGWADSRDDVAFFHPTCATTFEGHR